MIWLLVAVLFAAIVIGALSKPRAAATRPGVRTDDLSQRDPVTLAMDDPAQALLLYGTSDDAARLIADGHGADLAGLGYHPDGG